MVDVVRGMNAKEALAQLKFMARRPSGPIAKLLTSAIANAEHNFSLSPESLKIVLIKVDGGPVLKRFRPSSKGRAAPLAKKTSHVTVVLEGERVSAISGKRAGIQNKEDSLGAKFSKEKDIATTKQDSMKGAAFKKDPKIKMGSNRGFVKRMFQRKSI